jgi:hypothetical protein
LAAAIIVNKNVRIAALPPPLRKGFAFPSNLKTKAARLSLAAYLFGVRPVRQSLTAPVAAEPQAINNNRYGFSLPPAPATRS